MRIGARYKRNGRCEFHVWAPLKNDVKVEILSDSGKVFSLKPLPEGYWGIDCEGIFPGDRYHFILDGKKGLPDPSSFSQPAGVHGPSQVIDHGAFQWTDETWKGLSLADMIIYELHVSTFTPEGTFEAIISRLGELIELGVNTIELMPVSQFPGERNWGYDGVFPFAVQSTYGGVEGLKKLVNACHGEGIAVILDVVYNHLGPEGNVLGEFGPYFTEKYKTPWGPALNYDDAYSDGVRNFFIENALYWFREFHMDALRLDAIHAIKDQGAQHFLLALSERTDRYVQETGQRHFLIAESDLNDSRVIAPPEVGGFGMHAQWCDDFHHALHALLTGERQGYYADFGKIGQMADAFRQGYVLTGQFSIYRRRSHGNSPLGREADQFVVYSQNHDQIGNRVEGGRLSRLVSFEALKLAAGAVLLGPYVPLLFMGEEYAEDSPFLYFVSHTDPVLVSAVRKGRKEEFKAFGWTEEIPDPQGMETFERSKIHWEKRKTGRNRVLFNYYKNLIYLRKTIPALSHLRQSQREVWGNESERVVVLDRRVDASRVLCLFHFGSTDGELKSLPSLEGWQKILDSADEEWNGPGSLYPKSFRGNQLVVLHRNGPSKSRYI